jgi:hypothetical protein
MRRKIKECDRVIVPAVVDGFAEDRAGRVIEVKPYFGRKLVSVRFDHPDPNGRAVITLFEHQVIKIRKNASSKNYQTIVCYSATFGIKNQYTCVCYSANSGTGKSKT